MLKGVTRRQGKSGEAGQREGFAGQVPPAGVKEQAPRPRGDLTLPASWAVHPGEKVGCSYTYKGGQ